MVVKHRIIKTLFVVLLAVIIVATVLTFCLFFDSFRSTVYMLFPKRCVATDQEVVVRENTYNPANFFQKGNVLMEAVDGQLYFFCRNYEMDYLQTKYSKHLSVFDNKKPQRLIRITDPVIGMSKGIIYYELENNQIGCYDISQGDFLPSVKLNEAYPFRFDADGRLLCISKNGTDDRWQIIDNGKLMVDESTLVESYELNNVKYYVDTNRTEIFSQTESGVTKNLKDSIPYGIKTIIPCEAGLLVHNEGQGDVLYLISNNGNTIQELFSAPCLRSKSTVNVYGEYAYLSISRYKYDEEIDSTVLIKDDHFYGTFRIDLKDLSVTKINNSAFTGLYIFDSSGIFVCDKACNIYKLDFDGNVIMTLLESK